MYLHSIYNDKGFLNIYRPGITLCLELNVIPRIVFYYNELNPFEKELLQEINF